MHCVKSVQTRSFFWSVFFRIRTEYGEIPRISPYSVQMREHTDQKKLRIWTLFPQWYPLPKLHFVWLSFGNNNMNSVVFIFYQSRIADIGDFIE